ncbi:helix-turn-helix domain-containing protein [Candidatus Spongiihabitans sp.]|uniref:helix-turn-helix domain-containing protein n=1 Tax=Candidatus Spongiihabitans sp. TaxID=3101308 RepID=UPI003C7C3439
MVESDTVTPKPRPEPQPSTAKTAGEMLSSAREALRLSVEDVASNLNLGVDAIDALERNQYDRLPSCTFARGYLRAYARLLHLDADEVIAKVDLKPEQFSGAPTFMSALKLKSKAPSRSNKGRSNNGRPNKGRPNRGRPNRGRPNRGRPNKSRRLFFKFALFIIVLTGLSLFGLNQWSHLDTKKLAGFLKLPIAEDSAKTGNDSHNDPHKILFPATEN